MIIDDLIKIDNDLTKDVVEGKIKLLKGIGIDTDSFVINASTKLILPAEWKSRLGDAPGWFVFSPLVPVGQVLVAADPDKPETKVYFSWSGGLLINPNPVFKITV